MEIVRFVFRAVFLPALMHRGTSSSSSSSADRPWQSRSDNVESDGRSLSSSVSSSKSPVKFQIQKRTPVILHKSDRTEGSSQHGGADPKLPTPKSVGSSGTRTDALKNLSLYASEDSDSSEHVSEVMSRDKSGRGDVTVASDKKGSNKPNEPQKVENVQPKTDDSCHSSSQRHHKKEHSDARDRDRDESERKRSRLSNQRHNDKERESEERKAVSRNKSRDHMKSSDDRRNDGKSRTDEKAEAERSCRHTDGNSKESRDSLRRSSEKKPQVHRDSASHRSSSDRHRESSCGSKEPKKPQRDLPTVESKKVSSSHSTKKSPSRDSFDATYRKSSDSTSRSTDKDVAKVEASTVKQKSKEAERRTKVDERDLKPARNDQCQYVDERKPDTTKRVEKLESVDLQKEKLSDKKRREVKDDGRVDDKKDKGVPSSRKASASSASVSDKKFAVKREHDSTSSSSSHSSSGTSSSSDSDSSSSSGSSYSDSSDEDEAAVTKAKSSQLKPALRKDTGKPPADSSPHKPKVQKDVSKPSTYSDPQKSEARDISRDRSQSDSKMQPQVTVGVNVPVPVPARHEIMSSVRTEEATASDNVPVPVPARYEIVSSVGTEEAAAVSELTSRENSPDCKSLPAAVRPKVLEARLAIPEVVTQKSSAELYSPSFPTDVGWEDEVGGDAAGWSSSSESDMDDDIPPPPPPPPPPACPPSNAIKLSSVADVCDSAGKDRNSRSDVSAEPAGAKQNVSLTTVQPSLMVAARDSVSSNRNCRFDVAAKPSSSKQEITAVSSSAGPDNGSNLNAHSVSNTGKPADEGFSQKEGPEGTVAEVGDSRTEAVPDEKSRVGRRDKEPASDSRRGTEPDSRCQDRSRSSYSRSRRSHSRSRSKERRHRTPRDGGGGRYSQDQVDRHRGTASEKNSSRRREDGDSESPATVCRVDSPDRSPVIRPLAHSGSTRYSDKRLKTSSHGPYRSVHARRPASNAVVRKAFESDEPIVVIDTDDEDEEEEEEENIENIPLPVPLPNFLVDDIPLPAPVGESSNVAETDSSRSQVHPVEKKSDSPLPIKQDDESTSENQKSTEEEVVGTEAKSVDDDDDDMDLDDSDDSNCESEEKNVAAIESEKNVVTEETDSCKGLAVSAEKIDTPVSSCTQLGPDWTRSSVVSSDTSTAFAFAWKRKLGAGLLKQAKSAISTSGSVALEDSPTEKSNSNSASVPSATSEVQTNSDAAAKVKSHVLSDKPPSEIKVSAESGASSSYNAPVVEKSKSDGNVSYNTAALQQKPRRRFTDQPLEKSTSSSDDLPSKSHSAAVRNVQVVKSFHVLTGQPYKHQPKEGAKSDASTHSTAECISSVSDKSGKLANQDETTCSKKTAVDDVSGENSDSVSRTSQAEHKSDSHTSSSTVVKERIFSEDKRSRSPEPAKKNADHHRSSPSRTEKRSPSSSKEKRDTDTNKNSRDRNNSPDDRKKHSSSHRHRSRSPHHSSTKKHRRSASTERRSRRSRERSGRGDSRYSSSRRKDASPERKLRTSVERGAKPDAKDDDKFVRRSSDARDVETASHDVKYRERHTDGAVEKDTSLSDSNRRKSPGRSPTDRKCEPEKSREVGKSPRRRRSTSREKLADSRQERDERKSRCDIKTDSVHVNDAHSSSWQDDGASRTNQGSCGSQGASGRSYEHRSRRSPLFDQVPKPHMDDRLDRSIVENMDRSYEVNSRRSPVYDELDFRKEDDSSRVRLRSSSKEIHSSKQGRVPSLLSGQDLQLIYNERFAANDSQSRKTEVDDHSSSRNREYSLQVTSNYSNERYLVKEGDRAHADRRHETSQDRSYCLLSPMASQKMPRHSKHSPPPSERSEGSSSRYRKSLSREHSPKYQRNESLVEHAERRPSSREDELRLHGLEKRLYDRDEKSPPRTRQGGPHERRSSPRRKDQDLSYRRTSPSPDHGLSSSSDRREPSLRNRRSASRDRRYVERREPTRAHRSSRSPSQISTSQRSVSPSRSRFGLQEELERHARRKHGDSTDIRNRSPVNRQCRESSYRRSSSRDRRSPSGSRESPTSPHGRRYRRSRSDKRGDSGSRHGSRSPSSRPYRESRHSNRDIVQFLMDTGIIRSSKSDTRCRKMGSATALPVGKSPTSSDSTSASATPSVATSVAVTAAAAAESSSSFVSSYPVVPPPAVMPAPILSQMPYVDSASVPYIACSPYPPAFPAVPPAGVPSSWYPPPPLLQPHGSFPNQVPNQVPPVPYPGIQPVRSLLGVGPGLPPGIGQCPPVPGIPSVQAQDWHGTYGQTHNSFPDPLNQASFRPTEHRTVKPLLADLAGAKTASGHRPTGSTDRPKQESGAQQHDPANHALIKAIESAVWIPSADSLAPKATSHAVEPESSAVSDNMDQNEVKLEVPVAVSTSLSEPAEKTVGREAMEQESVSDRSSAVQSSPAGCLWECVPEVTVDASSLAAMEADNEAEDLAFDDGKGRKRRRGPSDGSDQTRRRSSRLRSKEEQKRLDLVDEDGKEQPSDPASKSASDTELSKPPVKNLKARILQDYESDAGNPNPSAGETCLLDAAASTNSASEATYKVPDESYSSMVTKPEKVKSRWRRWSELETDGEQRRVPSTPPSFHSPSSTTGTPANSAVDDENVAEEKPPYFEPILDNIFLSSRLVCFLSAPGFFRCHWLT